MMESFRVIRSYIFFGSFRSLGQPSLKCFDIPEQLAFLVFEVGLWFLQQDNTLLVLPIYLHGPGMASTQLNIKPLQWLFFRGLAVHISSMNTIVNLPPVWKPCGYFYHMFTSLFTELYCTVRTSYTKILLFLIIIFSHFFLKISNITFAYKINYI